MKLYIIEYLRHWGRTVAYLSEDQRHIWQSGGAQVVLAPTPEIVWVQAA